MDEKPTSGAWVAGVLSALLIPACVYVGSYFLLSELEHRRSQEIYYRLFPIKLVIAMYSPLAAAEHKFTGRDVKLLTKPPSPLPTLQEIVERAR